MILLSANKSSFMLEKIFKSGFISFIAQAEALSRRYDQFGHSNFLKINLLTKVTMGHLTFHDDCHFYVFMEYVE